MDGRARRRVLLAKRFVDVTFSAVGLVIAFPIGVIVAALVRWRLGSPILFTQLRASQGGRPMRILKFRTMTDERDDAGALLSDDRRLGAFGRRLRASRLDELPQLWNVLRGDMSLVGPRPLPMHYVDRYTPAQRRRLEMKPGLTGLAQTRGNNELSWREKFELDVWYVDHASLGLDLRILAQTVGVVLSRQGVHASGHATVPEFTGDQPPNAPGG